MNKEIAGPSEFLNLTGIEYFLFEEDFMDRNIRCIPMIVRFKMDKAGIKLKLSEWSKFSKEERKKLATMPCCTNAEVAMYNFYLAGLVKRYTKQDAKTLEIEQTPLWSITSTVPETLVKKLNEFGWAISIKKWRELTNLQRFALLKLCRPKHENRNFPKAVKEFSLLD